MSLAAAPFGISAAAIQQMMPNPMRGQASAVYLFIINMIGLGLGPTAVAVCTQYLFKRDDAVNYSLLVVHLVATFAGRYPAGRWIEAVLPQPGPVE